MAANAIPRTLSRDFEWKIHPTFALSLFFCKLYSWGSSSLVHPIAIPVSFFLPRWLLFSQLCTSLKWILLSSVLVSGGGKLVGGKFRYRFSFGYDFAPMQVENRTRHPGNDSLRELARMVALSRDTAALKTWISVNIHSVFYNHAGGGGGLPFFQPIFLTIGSHCSRF